MNRKNCGGDDRGMSETDKALEWMNKAAKLGWVWKCNDSLYMQAEDIQKLLCGIFDADYGKRIDEWVKQAVPPKEVMPLAPRDYELNKRLLESQSKFMSDIITGKQCIMKYDCCPFAEKVHDEYRKKKGLS
jgi:hypothetical protein